MSCLGVFLKPYELHHEKNRFLHMQKTKAQISCAVTAQLINSAIPLLLNPKIQASNNLLLLYRPVCVKPGRKPQRPVFSHQGSYEPHREKTGFLPRRKQRRRSASR